jgi:Zn-dependent membrane protease YugP
VPSEQDRIADGINKPLLAAAIVTIVIGFILTISIALIWLGLPIMGIGAIWAAVLYFSASSRAKHAQQ